MRNAPSNQCSGGGEPSGVDPPKLYGIIDALLLNAPLVVPPPVVSLPVVSLLFLLVAQAGAAALASRRQALGGISGVAAATAGSSAGAAGPAKTVVVTGASSGIGFAAASELARRGHRCVLACRSVESAEETARRLPEVQLLVSARAVP